MSSELEDFLTQPVGESTVTYGDLIDIGSAVLNMACVVPLMRHVSPLGSTEYADPDGEFGAMVVNDLIRWNKVNDTGEPSVEGERLMRFTRRSGWMRNLWSEFCEREAS